MGLSWSHETIKETEGTVEYDVDFNISWPSGSYNRDTSYSGSICNISVEDSSGAVTIQGLKSSQHYFYNGNYIKCDYSYNYKETQYGTDSNGQPTSWVETKSDGGTIYKYLEDVNIYTHPGSFSMDATDNSNSSKNIIVNVLSAKRINEEWIPHFQAVYRWYNQDDEDYTPANQIYPNNKSGMKVISGEPIYAEWFNNCMEGMRAVGHTNAQTIKVKGAIDNPPGNLITADLINQMDFFGTND